MAKVRIETAAQCHREGILRMLKEEFVKREPVEAATSPIWNEVRPFWEKIVDQCISERVSMVLVSQPNAAVVGMRLSRVIDLSTFSGSLYEWLAPGPLKDLLDQLTQQWPNIMRKELGSTANKKVLQFLALCVDSRYIQQGYARRMCEENMGVAKQRGCVYVTVVGSSWISQRIFRKLSFRLLGEIVYADLRDASGKPLLTVDPHHKCAQWYLKKL